MAGKTHANQPRAANWSLEEKELLFSLVSDEIDILECKTTDANAVKKRNVVWRDIHNKFSAQVPTPRPLVRLKEQWKRLKTIAKKEFSYFNKEQKRTGGGPAPTPPSDISVKVKDLLPNEFSQLNNPYDDDAEPLCLVAITETESTQDTEYSEFSDTWQFPSDANEKQFSSQCFLQQSNSGFSVNHTVRPTPGLKEQTEADSVQQSAKRFDPVTTTVEEESLITIPGYGTPITPYSETQSSDSAASFITKGVTARRPRKKEVPTNAFGTRLARVSQDLTPETSPETNASKVHLAGLSGELIRSSGKEPTCNFADPPSKRPRKKKHLTTWGSDTQTSSFEMGYLDMQKEEHQKRMEYMEEIHKAKMDILEAERQIAFVRLTQVNQSCSGSTSNMPNMPANTQAQPNQSLSATIMTSLNTVTEDSGAWDHSTIDNRYQ